MNDGKTCMWKMYPDDNIWRIQTTARKVYNKLKRRKTAMLGAWAINANLWIFEIRYLEPNKAVKGLGRLTGLPVHYIASEEVYVAENSPILHENK
jgi:hypothetical protein